MTLLKGSSAIKMASKTFIRKFNGVQKRSKLNMTLVRGFYGIGRGSEPTMIEWYRKISRTLRENPNVI